MRIEPEKLDLKLIDLKLINFYYFFVILCQFLQNFSQDVLLFTVLYNCELNIFELWTVG